MRKALSCEKEPAKGCCGEECPKLGKAGAKALLQTRAWQTEFMRKEEAGWGEMREAARG